MADMEKRRIQELRHNYAFQVRCSLKIQAHTCMDLDLENNNKNDIGLPPTVLGLGPGPAE